MSEPFLAPRDARSHIIVGALLGAVAIATLFAGRVPVSIFVGVLLVVAYNDLRRLLAPSGHFATFALGAVGTGAFLWCGYAGRLELLPAAGAALVLALLTSRIILFEIGARLESPLTADVAATIASTAVVGALGAHVLLIHAMKHVGFRALLVFGLAALLNDAAAFFVGRYRGRHAVAPTLSPAKTWEGALAGFVASVVVTFVAGLVADPPFDLASGLLLGAAVGVLVPIGDFAFSALKRSAGVKDSGTYLGPLGGVLDVVDGLLFAAPAFYWALRTIAL